MVQTFINNENPSLEDTIEAYHYRDINMNLSIEHTMNFIVKKAKDSIKIMSVVNETIATMLTARINTPRYKNLPPKMKAIAAGAT